MWLRSVGYTAQDFLKLSVTINWSAYSHETCVRARNPYVSFTDIPKLCKILPCRCLGGVWIQKQPKFNINSLSQLQFGLQLFEWKLQNTQKHTADFSKSLSCPHPRNSGCQKVGLHMYHYLTPPRRVTFFVISNDDKKQKRNCSSCKKIYIARIDADVDIFFENDLSFASKWFLCSLIFEYPSVNVLHVSFVHFSSVEAYQMFRP